MNDIAAALTAVRSRIASSERRHGRAPGSVDLLAVSKACPLDAIRAAAAAGQSRFGESYLSEALPKIASLAGLGLEWHFIGPIQSNKTRGIAAHFAWAHGLDRPKIAQRLSEQRPAALPPLQVCIQVNISAEPSKSGVSPEEIPALVRWVEGLPNLTLRGLMAIPAPGADDGARRAAFGALRRIYDDLRLEGHPLDTLSMGMSNDLDEAIAEGATLVRVGTAIFGERRPPGVKPAGRGGEFGAGLE